MRLHQFCAALALALTLFSAGCCCWRDCTCQRPLMRPILCRPACRPSCCETPCCAPPSC